ncbi:EF-hand calcium-binding domain-containing protein 6 [Grus japonensis]|uniref:EF-hand calcium-binding domain-containing protein 6 n=1 Tax=Grus japonensis TaxID=30415 RepID=A0ABC9VV02_GRUJA
MDPQIGFEEQQGRRNHAFHLAEAVLEDHGMPMDDSEFNLLTEKLGLPDGELSYLDFVAILEDARLNGPGATLRNVPNHRVNDAKYHYVTAEECLNQLNDKLQEAYGVNTPSHGLLLAVKLIVIMMQTFVLKFGLEELSGK